MSNATEPFAVRESEMKAFGCPYCGYRSASFNMSGGGTGIGRCGECSRGIIVCSDNLEKSAIGIGSSNGDEEVIYIYPMVIDHPRRGIPAHGRPDKRPDEGGEFFKSRGVGMDKVGCFVCDKDRSAYNIYLPNISGYVQCKDSGERIVTMVGNGAWLDYREHEPDYVQVKIGVCDEHLPCLNKLHELCSDGRITKERIEESRKQSKHESLLPTKK